MDITIKEKDKKDLDIRMETANLPNGRYIEYFRRYKELIKEEQK